MTGNTILILLFSLAIVFVAGCKTVFVSEVEDTESVEKLEDTGTDTDKDTDKGTGADTDTDTDTDTGDPDSKKKGIWEWEIAPEEPQEEVTLDTPVQKELSYPRKTSGIEQYTPVTHEGEKIDITFNFQGADIKEVLNVVLGEILEVNYTLDKRVTGLITLRTTGKYYREELSNIVQAVLNINGFALVKSGNIHQVVPIQKARSEAGVKNIGKGVDTRSRDVITQIVQLQYIAPQTIIPTLRGLLTKAGFVIAPNDTRAIIISEKISNMNRLTKIIETFDIPFFIGKALKFYEIEFVDAETLAKDLTSITQTLGAKAKGQEKDVAFIPFANTNKLLVVTNTPEIFPSIDMWISNIDVHLGEHKPRLYIYKMQHEQAEATVPILTELFMGKTTAQAKGGKGAIPGKGAKPGVVGAVSETMKIIADKNTNSIIIRALPYDYKNIKAIIETLDATPQQVLIEAVIVEVTLKDALAHGVEYFFRKKGGPSEGSSISLLPVTGTTLTSPLTGIGTKFFTMNRDIDAIFSLIATETEFELLSSPHLLVRDEQTASLQVGRSEPILTGTTTAGSGSTATTDRLSQIQYRDIGVILTVTPRIAENEMVTLDITQEVSKVTPSSLGGTPAFTIRKAETSLVVKSGHAIYLGGIIDIQEDITIKKIPLLGDIPYLGNLFRSTDRKNEKTELMVVITPHVINNASEANTITREFKGKLEAVAMMVEKH